MNPFSPLSTSDQLALHLRQEIHSGRIRETMPGVTQLVQALGVNKTAVTKALQQLEHEGLVISQGGRRRRLLAPTQSTSLNKLQIVILCYDTDDMKDQHTLLIQQELINSGHSVAIAPQSMLDLRMEVSRVEQHLQTLQADAWIINSGSRQILEWFEKQNKPAFALHGRLNNINLASMAIRRDSVMTELISKLVTLGHRRIVMLVREERRKPNLGTLEQFFLKQLEANGIQTGSYNIPDWEDTPAGLEKVIDSIFKHTPPTAIIISDPLLFHSLQVHLAHRKIWAPTHISLFCTDSEQSFEWVRPQIAHIQWDCRSTVRRINQWAKNVVQGKIDLKKSYTKAILYEGDTIGPAPRRKH